MKSTPNVNEWLSWLGRVRFLAITFLVGIVIAARHFTPMPGPLRSFALLIALWYTLAIFYVTLRRWVPQARWHAPLQIACDLLMVTGVVYSTGVQDSYFVSLYLLAILMASVLFSRRGVFIVAGFAFVLLGGALELTFYGFIPRTATSMPTLRVLDSWLASNLFAFFAVAYLGSLLAQTLRKKGFELDEQGNPLAARKEIEYKTAEGASRFLGLSISPLRTAQNQNMGFVYNFQDLTELKRLEREVVTTERMAALGRLSAAIAHEIRQPLTAMTGALKELARLAPLDEDDKKLVHIVSRESQRLNQIITDFRDYSRVKSYHFADIDVVPLIEETLLLLEHDATAAGKLRIVRNFKVRTLRARADRDALKQVFWNLCNNALRAMPAGGVLTVSVAADDNWVRIQIADTGIGIDPAQATRIFEPFQSGFTGGTGLGLAVVYQILQAHHGRIRVEGEKGTGADFIVEIPRSAARPRSAVPKLQDPREHDEHLRVVGKG